MWMQLKTVDGCEVFIVVFACTVNCSHTGYFDTPHTSLWTSESLYE